MTEINLRDLFPENDDYDLDCFVEAPDENAEEFIANFTEEIADIYFEFERKESAYRRRAFWNKAHYSLDRGDGIENKALNLAVDPSVVYADKEKKRQLENAIANLPDKQAKRVYAHYILGMKKVEIARLEGVNESKIRKAIECGLRNLEKYLKNFNE